MNVAALLYESDQGEAADALLADVAYRLKAAGWRLAGAVQSPTAPRASRCEMTLEDLATGRAVETSDGLGPAVPGCRLDTAALEDCVGLATAALTSETDLVVINRFGKRESDGRGFRPMIESAVTLEVPVLVGLKRMYLDAWTDFVGGAPLLLPLESEAVLGWCRAVARGAPAQEDRAGSRGASSIGA